MPSRIFGEPGPHPLSFTLSGEEPLKPVEVTRFHSLLLEAGFPRSLPTENVRERERESAMANALTPLSSSGASTRFPAVRTLPGRSHWEPCVRCRGGGFRSFPRMMSATVDAVGAESLADKISSFENISDESNISTGYQFHAFCRAFQFKLRST